MPAVRRIGRHAKSREPSGRNSKKHSDKSDASAGTSGWF
jgi:hypothetical protein